MGAILEARGLRCGYDGRAVLRGKVWPKGEQEPSAWTVEARDEVPNLRGSPGLYGNAKDTELYIDNPRVSDNP